MWYLLRVAQFYKNVTSLFKLNTLKINYKHLPHVGTDFICYEKA